MSYKADTEGHSSAMVRVSEYSSPLSGSLN
jgi:hypothetical protein